MTDNLETSLNDRDILQAHESWSNEEWNNHFIRHGLKPAGDARYRAHGDNNVLKWAIAHVHGRSFWYQGSLSCESRVLLLREAEIDHVIPQKASVKTLRDAVRTSSHQQHIFDVHDPGNLALICGPCNREKGRLNQSAYAPTPALEQRRAVREGLRDQVISAFDMWHQHSVLDDASLRALQGARLDDDDSRSIYADLIADMIFNLSESLGQKFPVPFGTEVHVEQGEHVLSIGPSGSAIEDYMEMLAEMEADDRRAESGLDDE